MMLGCWSVEEDGVFGWVAGAGMVMSRIGDEVLMNFVICPDEEVAETLQVDSDHSFELYLIISVALGDDTIALYCRTANSLLPVKAGVVVNGELVYITFLDDDSPDGLLHVFRSGT